MSTSISRQRSLETAQGLVVVRRETWKATFNYLSDWNSRQTSEPAIRLFFHITVTNPDAYGSEILHMRAIESIGIGRFPATGISYNMVVMPSGRIYEGQPIGRRGAHTGSYSGNCTESGCPNRGLSVTSTNHNVTARGVVIAQNVDDPVGLAQIGSVARIGAVWKRADLVTLGAPWHGHRCVSSKSCPGDKAWEWMVKLVGLTAFYTENGLFEEDEMELTDNLSLSGSTQTLIGAPTVSVDNALENALIGGILVKENILDLRDDLAALATAVAALPQSFPVDQLADAIVARLDDTADVAAIRLVVREELANLQLSLV